MPSLHVHPVYPYPHFISDLERFMCPLSNQAISLFFVLIIIIGKACHPDQPIDKHIFQLHEEAKSGYTADDPLKNLPHPPFHKPDTVPRSEEHTSELQSR